MNQMFTRRVSLLFLALFLCGSTTADVPESKPKRPSPTEGRKSTLCPRSSCKVEIDGRLSDDWRDVNLSETVVTGESDKIHLMKHYRGPRDACAAVFLKWDNENLYLAAVVVDDSVRNTREGGKELQRGDGILLCLTPEIPAADANEKEKYRYCFILSPGDFDKVKPGMQIVEGQPDTKCVSACVRTTRGYQLEAVIPLKYMPELKPMIGRSVGLEVCQYEGDLRALPSERTEILAWNSAKNRMAARECGVLRFGDTGKQSEQSPSDVDPAKLIGTPHKPAGIFAAREAAQPFAGYGIPLGLYFDRSERDKILAKSRTEPVGSLLTKMLNMCDSYLQTWHPDSYAYKDLDADQAELVVKAMDRLALAYVLTEEPVYAELARRTLLSLMEKRSNWWDDVDISPKLLQAALVSYDWIYNTLDEKERHRLVQAFEEMGKRLAEQIEESGFSRLEAARTRCVAGILGLAMNGKCADAQRWAELGIQGARELTEHGWGENLDDRQSSLSVFVLFAEPLRRITGRDLYLEHDLEAAYAEIMRDCRTKVGDAWAIDPLSICLGRKALASLALRIAAQYGSGEAKWFYETCFAEYPCSSAGVDDVFTIIWYSADIRPTAPDWYNEASQGALLKQHEAWVKEHYMTEAKEREQARKRVRPFVREQRKESIPFSAGFVKKVDESVLEAFEVKFKPDLLHQHPRLYFTKTDMPLMWTQMASTHQEYWEATREAMEKSLNARFRSFKELRDQGKQNTSRSVGDALGRYAFSYGISRRDEYGEVVKRFALGFCGDFPWDIPRPDLVQGHALAGLALAYDCAYDYFMPEERALIRDTLIKHARIMGYGYRNLLEGKQDKERKELETELRSLNCDLKYIGTVGRPNRLGNANNHSWVQKTGLATAAAAVYEDTEEAKEWMRRVRWEYQKILEIHGHDGASPEGGIMYWSYGLRWMLRYLELLYHISGENLYGFDWLKNTGYYNLYMLTPDRAHTANFGDNPQRIARIGFLGHRLASEFRLGHVQWLGDVLAWNENIGGTPGSQFWNVLWYDPSVKPESPDTLPTYRLFDDLEVVTMRTDWSENAVMVAFRCGPPMGYAVFKHGAPGYGHAHPDQNHFMIIADGRFLLWDPGYSRFKMTREHNTILVDGRGQIGEEEIWFHRKLQEDELARIEGFFGARNYCYVCGDAHKAYFKELGLKKFLRRLVFIDGRYVVTMDEIHTDEESSIDWLLHSENPIKQLGEREFDVENQPMALAVRVLEPEMFQCKMEPLMVRTDVTYFPDGHHEYVETPNQRGYMLRLSPSQEVDKVRFLAAYYPYEIGNEKSIPMMAKVAAKGVAGVRVQGGDRTDVVGFNLEGSTVTVEDIETDAAQFVLQSKNEDVIRYVVQDGRMLGHKGGMLVKASVKARMALSPRGGIVECGEPCDVKAWIGRRPASVHVNGKTVPIDFDRANGSLLLHLPAGRNEIAIQN